MLAGNGRLDIPLRRSSNNGTSIASTAFLPEKFLFLVRPLWVDSGLSLRSKADVQRNVRKREVRTSAVDPGCVKTEKISSGVTTRASTIVLKAAMAASVEQPF